MAIPDAVRKQDEDSEKAVNEFLQSQGTQTAAPDLQSEQTPPSNTPPANTETVTQSAGVDSADELKKQLAYEKHRNDSLQGRLESQLRPLNDLVRELRTKVAFLEGRASTAPSKPAEPAGPSYLRHLKPEEVENIGKDVVDVQSRIARGEAEAVVEGLGADIEERRRATEARLAALEQERQESMGRDLWAKVEQHFPGATQINDDPRWADFLDSNDPFSGRVRREFGEVAVRQGDIGRIVGLMKEFKASLGEPVVPPTVKPDVVKAASSAAPGTARSVGSPKPMIRESQIKKFYDDWTRGKFRGKDDEARKIEASITAAVEDGRVIPG